MDSQRTIPSGLKTALAAASDPVVVDTPAKLDQAAREWHDQHLLGLDTEFVRERTYRADLGLIQLSDGISAWLVDPVSIEDLSPLQSLLQNSSIEKVIHSGSEDFEVIYHQLGVQPAAVLDSQIACALLGQSLQLGYHHAVDWLLDIEIDKDHTRSNWLRRPLSKGQLRYAALDVVLLPAMMTRLGTELQRLQRFEWLQEEVARMQRKSAEDTKPKNAWKRIGGAGSLDDRERTVLAILAAWREQTAEEKNLARGFVVSDAALLAMARSRPSSRADLERIAELHPKSIQRYADVWFELISEAQSAPPTQELFQLSGAQRKWLKSMRSIVSQAAKRLNVDSALLASRKQLERLIAAHVKTGEVPERFKGWRYEVVTKELLKVMQ